MLRGPPFWPPDGPGGSCGLISVALAHKRRFPLVSGRRAAPPQGTSIFVVGAPAFIVIVWQRQKEGVVAFRCESSEWGYFLPTRRATSAGDALIRSALCPIWARRLWSPPVACLCQAQPQHRHPPRTYAEPTTAPTPSTANAVRSRRMHLGCQQSARGNCSAGTPLAGSDLGGLAVAAA